MTEDQFFHALFQRLPTPPAEVLVPPGDDCAAVDQGGGRLLLLAVDQVVAERHYQLQGPAAAGAAAAGRKLLARNLSDIAAMGGIPQYCLVALAAPAEQSPEWLARFLDGVATLGAEFNVHMIGGDLSGTRQDIVASLTIVGNVQATNICRRNGAAAGDALYVTGVLGSAVATGHHLTFTPRCAAGRWLADNHLVNAMIDISDGTLLDCRRLCEASGVAAVIDTERLPLRAPQTTIGAALTEGEDYELLFAVPPHQQEKLVRDWPFANIPLTRIGHITAGRTPEIRDQHGNLLSDNARLGYDHLEQEQ